MDYVVKGGETIYDVCINANGSLYALDENLDLNGLDSYTPTLYAGQRLTVSDIVRNNAATEVMEEHPLKTVFRFLMLISMRYLTKYPRLWPLILLRRKGAISKHKIIKY